MLSKNCYKSRGKASLSGLVDGEISVHKRRRRFISYFILQLPHRRCELRSRCGADCAVESLSGCLLSSFCDLCRFSTTFASHLYIHISVINESAMHVLWSSDKCITLLQSPCDSQSIVYSKYTNTKFVTSQTHISIKANKSCTNISESVSGPLKQILRSFRHIATSGTMKLSCLISA